MASRQQCERQGVQLGGQCRCRVNQAHTWRMQMQGVQGMQSRQPYCWVCQVQGVSVPCQRGQARYRRQLLKACTCKKAFATISYISSRVLQRCVYYCFGVPLPVTAGPVRTVSVWRWGRRPR